MMESGVAGKTDLQGEMLDVSHYSSNVQGVPEKVTEFEIEITPKIFDLENQFRYFCKARACSYFTR